MGDPSHRNNNIVFREPSTLKAGGPVYKAAIAAPHHSGFGLQAVNNSHPLQRNFNNYINTAWMFILLHSSFQSTNLSQSENCLVSENGISDIISKISVASIQMLLIVQDWLWLAESHVTFMAPPPQTLGCLQTPCYHMINQFISSYM